MKYPTLQEVEEAGHRQLARWYRFLESPGAAVISCSDFGAVMRAEGEILDCIIARLEEKGGMTTKVSQAIGWEEYPSIRRQQ